MSELNPFLKNPKLIELENKYDLVTALHGGTESLRHEGTKYLPKEPNETDANYRRRLEATVLYPAYSSAIVSTTGKLFAGETVITNASPILTPILEDIDEDSNNLETFAQQATLSAIHYGCSYILVDYPVMNENATLADEKAAGAQPYWVLLEAPQILEASPVKAGGKNRLGIFRFAEREAYRTGEFSIAYRDRVKEFRLQPDNTVIYRVFIKQDSKWVLRDEGTLLGMTDIPIVPVYTNKAGYFLGSPLFYDLAEENILNWKLRSDYNNVVHMVTIPMLAVTGATSGFDDLGVKKELTISPNTVLEFTNPNTKVAWVEVSGSASQVGRQAVEDSYAIMESLSLETLDTGLQNQTATAAMLSSNDTNAVIRVIEDQIENALNKAIDFTYMYLGVPNPGTLIDLIVSEEMINNTTASNDDATPSQEV